jgi:hypothetical protein
MKMLIRSMVCLVFLNAAWMGGLQADSLKPGEVSANAKWAAHLDIENLMSSRLGKLFIDLMEEQGELRKIKAFSTVFEFDPLKDLHSVTVYGTSYTKEEGIVLIKGRFDKKKILALAGVEGDYEEIAYQDHTIYKCGGKHDRYFGCFYRENLVVASNSQALLQEALGVLAQERQSMAEGGRLRGLHNLPEGTFFVAAANGFDKLAEKEPEAMMLKKADKIAVTAGEAGGEAFLQATLWTRDDQTAEQVHDVVRGLIAMGLLLGDQKPEVARLVRSARVTRDGRKIMLRESQPAEVVFKLLSGIE